MLRWLLIVSCIVGGVSCFSFNGNKTVEEDKDKNVVIKWTLNDLNNSGLLGLRIYIKEVEDENQILNSRGDLYNKDVKAFTVLVPSLPLSQRTKASYTYDATTKTGTVRFTITKLQMNDSNNYILVERGSGNKFTTTLSVEYPSEWCGTLLKSSYTVNGTEPLDIVLGACGKPQPVVKCRLGSDDILSSATQISQHNYSFSFIARINKQQTTNFEPCKTKKLVCTTGVDNKQTATVTANCDKGKISTGVCAGHIIGVQLGTVLICVAIYVFLVIWKKSKLILFVTCLLVGLILIVALSVNYGELRKKNINEACDKAFIGFGAVDVLLVLGIALLSLKLSGGCKTTDSSSNKTPGEMDPLRSNKNGDKKLAVHSRETQSP